MKSVHAYALSVVRDIYLEASKALLYYYIWKVMIEKMLTTSRCSLRINPFSHCKLSAHTINCSVAMYLQTQKWNSMAWLSQENCSSTIILSVTKYIFPFAVSLDYKKDSEGPLKNKKKQSCNSSRKQRKRNTYWSYQITGGFQAAAALK